MDEVEGAIMRTMVTPLILVAGLFCCSCLPRTAFAQDPTMPGIANGIDQGILNNVIMLQQQVDIINNSIMNQQITIQNVEQMNSQPFVLQPAERQEQYVHQLENDVYSREAELTQLRDALRLNTLEVTIVRYYGDERGSSSYLFVNNQPIGYVIEPPAADKPSRFSAVSPGSYRGRFWYDTTAVDNGWAGSIIELPNASLLEIANDPTDVSAEEFRKAIYGTSGARFVQGKERENTGELAMALMISKGKSEQYFQPDPSQVDRNKMTKRIDDKSYPDDAQKYFMQKSVPVLLVHIGSERFQKQADTTNCVYAPLEALYLIFGGEAGSVNGRRITDPHFNGFVGDFIGPGDDWVKRLVKEGIAVEITDRQKMRIGDLVQVTVGHRGFIKDLIVGANGAITQVS